MNMINQIKKIFSFIKKPKIKVAFLLESTDLWGGVKVVFRQAEALNKIGYKAVVICGQAYPEWLNSTIGFAQQDPFDKNIGRDYDILITTGFLLTPFHYKHQSLAKVIHLCQGYEGDFKEAEPIIDKIEAAYNLPIPRLVITKKLQNLFFQRFNNQQVFNIGQGLEHNLFFGNLQHINLDFKQNIHLFLFGLFSPDVKQIEVGLLAYKEAKKILPQLRLIRVSLHDTRLEEENIIGPIHEYYVNILPEKVGELFRTKPGLLLAPSKEAEGFGLPPLEAMSCGVPSVLTRISSFLSFDQDHDYAEFVDVGNIQEMAKGINEIIQDHTKRKHIIYRGLEIAQKYNYENVAEKIDKAFIELHKR